VKLEENWTTLRDYARKAVKKLEKTGVTDAEAFLTCGQRTDVSIRNSEILTQNRVSDAGVGFRAIVDKDKVGFACTNTLNQAAIMDAAQKALAMAKVSSRVPDFALAESNRIRKVKALFDPKMSEVPVEQAVDVAKRAVDAAEGFDRRVTVKDGRVSYVFGWRGVINTLGVDCEEQETRAYIYLGGNGRQNGEVTGGCFDFMLTREAKLDPEGVGQNVAKMIVSLFNAKPLRGFEGTAVFGPEAVSYQLFDALVDALNASNVVRKRSAWSQCIGEHVASEQLTIIDTAILEGGFDSRSFDDEGYPSRSTALIDKGVLKSFLHYATTARALKMENTGNASRYAGGTDMARMVAGNGYRTKPEIYPSNLLIQPGNKSNDELISEIKKGVLVESMSGFAQSGSGVISAQISRAFYIQNGEIQHAIKGGMVSGVAFDWFKHVSATGNCPKQFQNAVVPSVCVENVRVVGA
jgi:PmbA protein